MAESRREHHNENVPNVKYAFSICRGGWLCERDEHDGFLGHCYRHHQWQCRQGEQSERNHLSYEIIQRNCRNWLA